MELILWRHAEARDGTPDSTRELTGKGMRQAKSMAEWLDSRLVAPLLRLAGFFERGEIGLIEWLSREPRDEHATETPVVGERAP